MKSYLATASFALLLTLGGCARQTPQPLATDFSQVQQASIAGVPVTSAVYEPGSNSAVFTEAAYHRRYQRRSYGRHGHRSRYVVHRRSGRKSAAIIGGSAAGGAAIGALAGGGKGAAIGALIGGGGGLAYDRATHKQVRRY